ncbi:hypothetical protein [Pseudofrankia asymbiotica]|uniref:HTH cro/C1-type domain-containing protein n=1 Tax=Pseudofrankia asymbiotica TaxID=1834516 RepID=A0A1V2HZG1_9ACTN|nr:hypothetical protein [Pseudofrankia asymbiotica]ONH22120.1 hypothetical protein BL253_36680 [Pseudofrankia asymbiotica]
MATIVIVSDPAVGWEHRMTSHPRAKRRPLPTTPALLALVDEVQGLIDARGLNYTLLADLTGFSRTHVKNLAEGRVLSVSGFRALDTALGANRALLRMRDQAFAEREAVRHGYASHDPAEESPPESTRTGVPSIVEGGDYLSPRRPVEVSSTNRRDLLALIGAGTTLGAIPALTPTDRLLLLEGTARADSILPVVDAQIAGCVSAYRTTSPAALIGQIDSVQRLIDGISANLSLRPADSTRLWHAATITAGLRGWVHNNAGEIDAARVSLAEAHKRADLLDDDSLVAWTCYMQAIVEDYAGNANGAQQYANDGLRHARTGPQRALLLSDALAKSRANLGDAGGVDAAVDEAIEIVRGLSPTEHGPASRTIIDDITTLHPAFVVSAAATSYARLGKPGKVLDLANSGAGQHQPYMLLDEALAVSRSGKIDPERIAALVGQGLSMALPFQSAHVESRVRAVQRAVEPIKAHPALRAMVDTTRTWREQRRTLTA